MLLEVPPDDLLLIYDSWSHAAHTGSPAVVLDGAEAVASPIDGLLILSLYVLTVHGGRLSLSEDQR